MAVTLSHTDPLYYASLFGVNPGVIDAAKALGLSINSSSMGVLKVQDAKSTVYGTVQVKGAALTLAKNGNMGPASKQVIQHQLETALANGITALGGNAAAPAPVDTSNMTPGQKAAVTKALKSVTLADIPEKLKVKLHSSTGAKPLTDANILYEEVAGSTSVYRVLAIYPGLNLAMRRTSHKVSLRAEGPNLNQHKGSLTQLGFDDHDSYMSVHFDIGNDVLTRKTVGALYGLLGLSNAIALGEPLKITVEA